ncbi:galactokinase [Parasediminibacterium sp. JCM 36343]|uniref:galactokinase n=1 Tax=Parasediminibacterium sp. JCM 36343 TaxID=3374279 RepID=UPI00397E5608
MKSTLVQQKFNTLFNEEATTIVRSPGRINLIGEHIDYNDGFVLPASIDKEIVLAIAPNTIDGICTLYAADFNDTFTFSLSNLEPTSKGWPNYVLGVIVELNKAGYQIKPFNCVFGGNIPTGAGLSSSAAVECGIAFALNEIFGLGLTKLQIVQFSKQAENNFVGVNCGIMDQFASTFGKAHHVIKLDCKSLDYEYFPFQMAGYDIVLCDTGVKHSLGDSEYNTRRQECDSAIAVLKEKYPSITSFRDVTLSQIQSITDLLPTKTIDRATYVVQEIKRVSDASILLNKNDLEGFGQLMYQCHEGLSKLYEVSCIELDFLKNLAFESGQVTGSRMMGGGFGGCTINLVKKENTATFIDAAIIAYQEKFKKALKTYIVAITDGTSMVG